MRNRAVRGAFLLCLVLVSRPAFTATGGSLRGRVVDAGGAPLSSVVLQITSRTAAIALPAGPTDAGGRFQVSTLPPANDYVVHASLPGYAALDLTDVRVDAGRATTLTITLSPASSVTELVQVRGVSSVLDPAPRGLASDYSAEFIDNLPILGR